MIAAKIHADRDIAKAVRRSAVFGAAAILLAGCAGVNAVTTDGLSASARSVSELRSRQNIASLSQAVRTNPQDASAYNLRGTAYAKARNYKAAMSDFNKAISYNPKYYQAYANRALVFVKTKRYAQAMADYNRVLEMASDYHVAYIGRGKIYKQMKNYSLALADFGKAIELRVNDPIAYYNRALVYQLLNQHDNAITDFDTAIGLRPESPSPYFGRGQSLMAKAEYEKAYDDFFVAAKRGKNHYRAWAFRGLAAERFGDNKKAVRSYRRALRIRPDFTPARQGLQRLGASQA